MDEVLKVFGLCVRSVACSPNANKIVRKMPWMTLFDPRIRIWSMRRYLGLSFTGDGIAGNSRLVLGGCCQPRWETDVLRIG